MKKTLRLIKESILFILKAGLIILVSIGIVFIYLKITNYFLSTIFDYETSHSFKKNLNPTNLLEFTILIPILFFLLNAFHYFEKTLKIKIKQENPIKKLLAKRNIPKRTNKKNQKKIQLQTVYFLLFVLVAQLLNISQDIKYTLLGLGMLALLALISNYLANK